jgi:hypothetical protein
MSLPPTRRVALLLISILSLASAGAAVSGCSLSKKTQSDEMAIKVTRDFGAEDVIDLKHEKVPKPPGLAVIFQRYANLRHKQSLFVNGIVASEDAADLTVHGGDRVWLDQHNTNVTEVIPAVVGSFPEPFIHGTGGKRLPVRVECDDPRSGPCAAVAEKLVGLGVVAGRSIISRSAADESLRILVGPWKRLRGRDLEADSIDKGPQSSGVYARFDASGDSLAVLDPGGGVAETLGAGTGFIAATSEPERQPVWFVSGTDAAGVAAAARAFDESVLADRFALAISDDLPVAVPQP